MRSNGSEGQRKMQKVSQEKAVERLEEIVEKLENGNLPLEDMMKLYEEGTALAAKCSKSLDEAQLKITELTAGKGDN